MQLACLAHMAKVMIDDQEMACAADVGSCGRMESGGAGRRKVPGLAQAAARCTSRWQSSQVSTSHSHLCPLQ
jgi:hypothetical protein